MVVDAGVPKVQDHVGRIVPHVLEKIREGSRRTEKEGTGDLVGLPRRRWVLVFLLRPSLFPGPVVSVVRGGSGDRLRLLPGKAERRGDHPRHHGLGQVVPHGHKTDEEYHGSVQPRDLVQDPQAAPAKGRLADRQHDPDQCRDGDAGQQGRPGDDAQRQKDRDRHPRQLAPPAARFDVDDALAQEGAAADAARQSAGEVAESLSETFLARGRRSTTTSFAAVVHDVVDELHRQEGFDGTDGGHGHRVGGNDSQRLQREGNPARPQRQLREDRPSPPEGIGTRNIR
mmetsp:Transcript_24843/g.55479  ORF Transcript_24843/g.55479 Transcript_24843/m.55479 type:complete len:285 (-) Transcript_24843:18-872(-)